MRRIILGLWFTFSMVLSLLLGFLLPLGWALSLAPFFGGAMGAGAYFINEKFLS